jgi:hypothetical protein
MSAAASHQAFFKTLNRPAGADHGEWKIAF